MITTIPTVVNLRTPLSDSLQEIMDFNAEVQVHQFTSLKKMQSWMGFAGDTLFDTIFTYQKRVNDWPATKTRFNFHRNVLAIDYPVSVELEPINGYLRFSIYYKSSYMQNEQANLIAQQYHFLLANIIRERHQTIQPRMPEAGHQLFSVVPAKQEKLSSECTLLHHAVELQAQKSPNKVAIEFVTGLGNSNIQTEAWTYRQLDDEGNKVANLLSNYGVIPKSIVVICFDKCPEAAFTMLGILKAGCVFLALDPNAPAERNRFIVEDSQASVLISKNSMAENFTSILKVPIINLDKEDMASYSSDPVVLSCPIDPQNTSYCLYTSGTSGTPKGCLVTHDNVVQVLLCFEQLYNYSTTSRWLQFASYHFDVSVMEHFWSWFVGITVVKASRDLILEDLSAAVSSLKITHIDLTPSLARLLDPRDVPTLASGVFITGGEMLRADIIEKWGDSGAIHNAYGPTEATIGVTMYRHVPKNGRASNIGWPFPVVGVFVTDPADYTRPVLRGGVGELCLSGKLVAKGYLHRDELTKQRFITIGSHRCYRTGDIVRLLSDGSIEFLGRNDDQVKLRGQRLEVGEINTVIKRSHDKVDDVSTLVLKHPTQQKEQLVSFVVVSGPKGEEDSLTVHIDKEHSDILAHLRDACADKLPGFMVPTHILPINRIPLSANNKVERQQLKAFYEKTDMGILQDLINHSPTSDLIPAKLKHEENIWEILSKILGRNKSEMLRNSTFFELGLDSVSLINFANSLRSAGYSGATPSLVMKNTTVSRLARVVDTNLSRALDPSIRAASHRIFAYQHRNKSSVSTTLAVDAEAIEEVVPCTPLQAGIISRSLERKKGLYFSSFTFDVDKAVDIKRLRNACQLACDNIQMLRVIFCPADDGYLQVVMRQRDLPWIENCINDDNLISETLDAARQHWQDCNGDTLLRPFEIVITKTPTTTLFTLQIFHALYDGNSLALILQAVSREYDSDLKPCYGPPFVEALPFGPLCERQGARSFWQKHLSALSLIPQHSFNPLVSNGALRDTNISRHIESIHGFEEIRRRLNVTSQAIVQACWMTLLQGVLHEPLVIGVVISGRSIEFTDADKVIGPLFNTVPMLLILQSQDSWRDIILRCHDFNRSVLEYQHTSLRDIQKWVRRDMFRQSLFEALFTFQKERQVEECQKSLWQLRDETFEADYPLSIEIEQRFDNSFVATLTCQAHISNEEFSCRLLERFEQTLKLVIEDVDQPLSNTVSLECLTIDHYENTCITNGNFNGANGWHHVDGNTVQNDKDMSNWSMEADHVCSTIATLARVDLNQITLETSIFEVGLDSIDAVKLSSRLQKVTNVRLPVSQIMRLLTVEKIAAAISEQAEASEARNEDSVDLQEISEKLEASLQNSGLDLREVEQVLPCTPLQESMIADMLNSHFERYLNFDVLLLNDNIDIEKLKTAWRVTIENLPILRSRFVNVEDPTIDFTFAQLVMKVEDFVWKHYETNEDFLVVTQKLRKDIEASFHEMPALRLSTVQRLGSARSTHMILALPHAMYDGVSLKLIHGLVSEAYNGNLRKVAQAEPALSKILNAAGTPSSRYWQLQLSGITPTYLPTNSKSIVSYRSERASSVSLAQIQEFCKQNGVTVSALSQTTWSIVLAHYAKKLDVCFAQILSGRSEESTKGVVFPTMNTVIFRTFIHGTRSEMVQFVQKSLTSNSEHQHFPFRKALSFISNRGSVNPLNTLFIFQSSATQDPGLDASLYESIESVSDVEYPVCIEAEIWNQQLVWRTMCKQSHFDQHQVEYLLTQLNSTLKNIVQYPDEPVVRYLGEQLKLCNLESFTEEAGIPAQQGNTYEVLELPEGCSHLEEEIKTIIAKVAVLDKSDVKKSSNVFGLGLDSISIIKVSSMLRKQGIQVTVNEILAAGSIQKIAEVAEKASSEKESVDGAAQNLQPSHEQSGRSSGLPIDLDVDQLLIDSGVNLGSVEQIISASSGQIFILSRWQNQGVYYPTLDFWINRCDNIQAIRSAWSLLVAQNPILRTVLVATGRLDHPIVQAVLRDTEIQCIEVASTHRFDEEINVVHTKYEGSLSAPCALFIQRAENNQFHLAFKMSHALYDGFSLAMLTQRLRDLLDNPESPSKSKSQSFPEYLSHATTPTRRSFWTNYFADLRVPPPSEAQAQAHNDQEDAATVHVVTTNTFRNLPSLNSVTRANQLSTQSVLLATYAVVHSRRLQHSENSSAQNEVVIGIYLANRTTESADAILAPTLGFVPLRINQPLQRDIFDIALGIQDDMRSISTQGHGHVGLWELFEWTGHHIRPGVWINILRPPSQTDPNPHGIQVVSGEKSEDIAEEFPVVRCDENIPRGLLLKNNAVRRFYDYPMMDLEITIGEESLDVGVLAPKTVCDVDGARGIIGDFEAELDKVVKSVEGDSWSDY